MRLPLNPTTDDTCQIVIPKSWQSIILGLIEPMATDDFWVVDTQEQKDKLKEWAELVIAMIVDCSNGE